MVTSDTFLRDKQLSRASLSLLCVFVEGRGDGEVKWGGLVYVCVVCMCVYAFLHVCVFLCVEARG